CQAVKLQPARGKALVLDDDNVYFTINFGGTIRVVSKAAPTQVALDYPSSPAANSIAVDDSTLFWSAADSILSAPKSGGSVNTVTTLPPQGRPADIVVDDAKVFFTATDLIGPEAIWFAPKNGVMVQAT